MSILFTPFNLRSVELANRFVFSACEDNLAAEGGLATNAVIRKYRRLARGEVGLIISGHMSVNPYGRTRKYQLGIHTDEMLPGLRQIAESVHGESGKIVFQLGHSGRSADHGNQEIGGATGNCNQVNGDSIREIVRSFGRAAKRAAEAGADGIQLHCAHGYLINQFLSPFFNHRDDEWGGSEENRFRMLKEIVTMVRDALPEKMLLLAKLNAEDHTPQEGITPSLAAAYAARLAGLGIDGLEISCGTTSLSPWNMCRGEIPVSEIVDKVPESRKSAVRDRLEKICAKVKFEEAYNLDAAQTIRAVTGTLPVFAVGGWRRISAMEEALGQRSTDLISMCRPFIREPRLVKQIGEGRITEISCSSCNMCLVAVGGDMPVRCYNKGRKFRHDETR